MFVKHQENMALASEVKHTFLFSEGFLQRVTLPYITSRLGCLGVVISDYRQLEF